LLGGFIKKITTEKILIAGGSGLIGTFLVKNLNDDFNIVILGNKKKIIKKNYYTINLNNKDQLKTQIKNIPYCSSLIYLVALAHNKGKGKEIEKFRNTNKVALINLLLALENENIRPKNIIFSSTISVYGEQIDRTYYNEDSITKPLTPYAVTKLEAENYLLKNFKNNLWILRFAPVYGEGLNLNINRRTKFFNMFYRIGDGNNKISLCNINNISVTVKKILNGDVPNGIYNISDSYIYNYNDLLTHVNAKWILKLPKFLIKIIHAMGLIIKSPSIIENSTKLISDNIFPSTKIRNYIDLPMKLNNE
jgi:nucleoside-diphosphate-sugar epimerase